MHLEGACGEPDNVGVCRDFGAAADIDVVGVDHPPGGREQLDVVLRANGDQDIPGDVDQDRIQLVGSAPASALTAPTIKLDRRTVLYLPVSAWPRLSLRPGAAYAVALGTRWRLANAA